jgi:hypothetical protein
MEIIMKDDWAMTSHEKSPGYELIRLRAENERLERDWEALHAKFDGCPHSQMGEGFLCGCSYDSPSDVCAFHAPQLRKAQERIADLEAQVAALTMPRHDGSVEWRKEELSKWAHGWFQRHSNTVDSFSQMLWELEFEAEHRGWQTAHDKRDCGHPLAFWQDRNWPKSETSYNPGTKSSDPPMEYACLLCVMEAKIAALSKPVSDEEIAVASANDWQSKRISAGGFSRIIAARLGAAQKEVGL